MCKGSSFVAKLKEGLTYHKTLIHRIYREEPKEDHLEMRINNPNKGRYSCKDCTFVTINIQGLTTHLKAAHLLNDPKPITVKCEH